MLGCDLLLGRRQNAGIAQVAEGILVADHALAIEILQRMVQRDHSVLPTGLHHRQGLVHLVVPHQGTDGRIGHHDLKGGYPTSTIFA